MQLKLLLGTVFISAALVIYTAAVLHEKVWKLGKLNLTLFWLGLIADMTGTEFMRQIAGGFSLSLHFTTGLIALLLMLFHAVWATLVLKSGDEDKIRTFHRYSLVVWMFWLVAYFSGLALAMGVSLGFN